MTALTTRTISGNNVTVKNAPLSNAEIDNNFINLNDSKIEISEKGTSNGVATLDENGKLVASQQNEFTIGMFPLSISDLSAGDHLEFSSTVWSNVSRSTITNGGNF